MFGGEGGRAARAQASFSLRRRLPRKRPRPPPAITTAAPPPSPRHQAPRPRPPRRGGRGRGGGAGARGRWAGLGQHAPRRRKVSPSPQKTKLEARLLALAQTNRARRASAFISNRSNGRAARALRSIPIIRFPSIRSSGHEAVPLPKGLVAPKSPRPLKKKRRHPGCLSLRLPPSPRLNFFRSRQERRSRRRRTTLLEHEMGRVAFHRAVRKTRGPFRARHRAFFPNPKCRRRAGRFRFP